MGHARALLGLAGPRQSEAARLVADRGLSVRQTEALVRRLQSAPAGGGEEEAARDPDIGRLETRLADLIGSEVSIRHGKRGSGRLVIRYHSLDELDGILERIDPGPRPRRVVGAVGSAGVRRSRDAAGRPNSPAAVRSLDLPPVEGGGINRESSRGTTGRPHESLIGAGGVG